MAHFYAKLLQKNLLKTCFQSEYAKKA